MAVAASIALKFSVLEGGILAKHVKDPSVTLQLAIYGETNLAQKE